MLFDFLRKKQKEKMYPAYLYTEQELEEYEAYVEKSLGHYDKVFHEIASPDIHLDVILIPRLRKDRFTSWSRWVPGPTG